jgi:hypothetical protein
MSLLMTGWAAVAMAPIVAWCYTLRAHSMFVLGGTGLIPFERCPMGP